MFVSRYKSILPNLCVFSLELFLKICIAKVKYRCNVFGGDKQALGLMCEDVLNGFRACTCYKSYLEIHFFFTLDNSLVLGAFTETTSGNCFKGPKVAVRSVLRMSLSGSLYLETHLRALNE